MYTLTHTYARSPMHVQLTACQHADNWTLQMLCGSCLLTTRPQPVVTPMHEGCRPPAINSHEMCEMCRYTLRLLRYVLLAFHLSISGRNV